MASCKKQAAHPREEPRYGCPGDSRREALENAAMCRHSHPIPLPAARCCGCCHPCEGEAGMDDILAVLNRQTQLLCELVAAVSGLTAACLCTRETC